MSQNSEFSYMLNPHNGFLIKAFFDDMKDQELKNIIPFFAFLKEVAFQFFPLNLSLRRFKTCGRSKIGSRFSKKRRTKSNMSIKPERKRSFSSSRKAREIPTRTVTILRKYLFFFCEEEDVLPQLDEEIPEKTEVVLPPPESKGLTDSESNLTLPNEYDKAPSMNHLDSINEGNENPLKKSDSKKERANSGFPALKAVRYSYEEDNVNSPLSKSQKL